MIHKDALKIIDYLLWTQLITVPLSIWKAVDILIWIYRNVSIGIPVGTL